ncbi:type II secretion system protein [Botrimarina colliarenosi]|nr:type II secretion system protein [Botrimarina colliarenosi]
MRTEETKRLARGDSAFRNPQSAIRRPGFTLVELLVVITIIGILAALLVAAIGPALRKANQTTIVVQIGQLDAALKDYQNVSGSYPPNTQTDGTTGPLAEATVLTDFKQHFQRAFPSHRERPQMIEALVGLSVLAPDSPVVGTDNNLANDATNLPGGMTAAEALVFWVGGFSDDPKYPISGPGGPSYPLTGGNPNEIDPIADRGWRLGIDLPNLGPRDPDTNYFPANYSRHIEFADPRDGSVVRRINFWVLRAPGSQSPYLYFDASRGSGVQGTNDAPAATLGDFSESDVMQESLEALFDVYAIKKLAENAQATLPYQFANNGKFQILHAGVDDEWAGTPRIDTSDSTSKTLVPPDVVYPRGPWELELLDTLTNFSDGTLEDAQP